MIRLFVAINLPSDMADQIDMLCFGIPGARWISPEDYHLTLSFIGEVNKHTFNDIRSCLSNLDGNSFFLKPLEINCFYARGRPKILNLSFEKNPGINNLRKKINYNLSRRNISIHRKKFTPHVTIARLTNTPANRVATFLGTASLPNTDPIQINSFHLYSSQLTKSGSIYQIEESYPLV